MDSIAKYVTVASVIKKLSLHHLKKWIPLPYILYATAAVLAVGGVLIFLILQPATLTFFGIGGQQNTPEPLVIEVPFENLTSGAEQFALEKLVVPEHGYMVAFRPEGGWDKGVVVSLDLYYHGASDLYCAQLPARVFHASSQAQTLAIPQPYGIEIEKGERLFLSAHLKNISLNPASGSLRVRIEMAAERKPVTPVILSIADYCSASHRDLPAPAAYAIPARTDRYQTAAARIFPAPANAKLVAWAGYLEPYGARLDILNGSTMITSLSVTSTPQGAADFGVLHALEAPISLLKGDALTLQATHEKPKGIKSAEAIGLAYILLDLAQ